MHRNSLKSGYKLHWYEIKGILGQGGFGITYLAQDTNLDEDVAIKEYLPTELAVREGDSVHPVSEDQSGNFKWGLDRFIKEARTLTKFKHPNIVRVRSVFEENNTAYMVMEYEQGESLQDILTRRETLEESALLRILLPVLDGLVRVHEAGFIHRDIKPANIFVRKDGSPVLLDFGSARQSLGEMTKTLTTLVSPGYAPFEQYYSKSDQQGPWTDIYGLGATLYRAVTGKAPLDAVDRSKSILDGSRDLFVPAVELGKGRYSEKFLKAIDHALRFRQKNRPQNILEWKTEFGIKKKPAISLSQLLRMLMARIAPVLNQFKTLLHHPATGIIMIVLVAGIAIFHFRDDIGASIQTGITYFESALEERRIRKKEENQRLADLEEQRLAVLEIQRQQIEADKKAAQEQKLKKQQEQQRLAEEEKQRLEEETRKKDAEEQRLIAEQEQKRLVELQKQQDEEQQKQLAEEQRVKEEAEKQRLTELEKQRLEEEASKKAEEEQRLAEEKRLHEEKEKKQAEDARLAGLEQQRKEEEGRKVEEEKKEKYAFLIAKAGRAMANEDKELAISKYTETLALYPDDNIAKQGLQKANELIDKTTTSNIITLVLDLVPNELATWGVTDTSVREVVEEKLRENQIELVGYDDALQSGNALLLHVNIKAESFTVCCETRVKFNVSRKSSTDDKVFGNVIWTDGFSKGVSGASSTSIRASIEEVIDRLIVAHRNNFQ